MPRRADPYAATRAERIARQGIHDGGDRTVARAAALTCAIQAQDAPASRLGIRLRCSRVTDAGVLTSIADDRSVVRTWLLRGTIHLVDTRDVRWLVRLIGPVIERKCRTRWRQLGLTDELLRRSLAAMPDILSGPPLTRRAVADALVERGVALPSHEAGTHVLIHASTAGLLCRGPEHGRDATFTLLDTWVPDAPPGPDGDEAVAELARRYFAAFSPATAADFATWSGLPSSKAIASIRDELTPVDVAGRPGFRLGEIEPAGGVRLLPAFDNYLIGYRDRDAIIDAGLRGRVYEGGMIRPTVLVDGRVVGSWALDRSSGTVRVRPFKAMRRGVRRRIDDEVADLVRFLDRPLDLEVAEPG